MSNLLIVGNGFDISHGLETSYRNFKRFLCGNANIDVCEGDILPIIEEIPELPLGQIYTGKGKIYNLCAECRLLYWLIDTAAIAAEDMEWNKFESLLGELDYVKVIEKYKDKEGIVPILMDTLGTLENVFFDWVSEIEISDKIKPKKYLKKHIIPERDLAISFNYTETLESVYGLKEENICYIHGKRETDKEKRAKKGSSSFGKSNEKLIVGYGRTDRDKNKEPGYHQETVIGKNLILIVECLLKDSESIVNDNSPFFDKIRKTNIRNIYSYGFSYSSVDEPQIEAVCDALNGECEMTKDMTWYLNEFDEKENKNEEYKKVIIKYGFKGKFDIYSSEKDNE